MEIVQDPGSNYWTCGDFNSITFKEIKRRIL